MITNNTTKGITFYDRGFFDSLSPQRLHRLSVILKISEGLQLRPMMYGFFKAYYYVESKLWYFYHDEKGLFIITDSHLRNIGKQVDSLTV